MDTPVLLTAMTYTLTIIFLGLSGAATAAIYRTKAKGNMCLALGMATADFCTMRIATGISPTANAGIKVSIISTIFSGFLVTSGLTSAALVSPSTDTAFTLAEAISPWVSQTWTEPKSNKDETMITFNLPGDARTKRQIAWQAFPASTTLASTTHNSSGSPVATSEDPTSKTPMPSTTKVSQGPTKSATTEASTSEAPTSRTPLPSTTELSQGPTKSATTEAFTSEDPTRKTPRPSTTELSQGPTKSATTEASTSEDPTSKTPRPSATTKGPQGTTNFATTEDATSKDYTKLARSPDTTQPAAANKTAKKTASVNKTAAVNKSARKAAAVNKTAAVNKSARKAAAVHKTAAATKTAAVTKTELKKHILFPHPFSMDHMLLGALALVSILSLVTIGTLATFMAAMKARRRQSQAANREEVEMADLTP